MAQKYGYRWENQVLNRTDDKIVAKSTVKNRKIPFLTVNLDFLYGYTMQILILNRIGASCRVSNRGLIWEKESTAVFPNPGKSTPHSASDKKFSFILLI